MRPIRSNDFLERVWLRLRAGRELSHLRLPAAYPSDLYPGRFAHCPFSGVTQ